MKKPIPILTAILFSAILTAQTKHRTDDVSYYRQLLQERRELAAKGKGNILPTVDDVLIDLAFLHIGRKEYSEALPFLEELLELAAKGQADGLNVEAIEEELAKALEEVGDEYYAEYDYNTAEKYYLRSLEINEKLAKNNIKRLSPDVARLLVNIGNIYHNGQKDYRKAEKYYLQSLPIHEKLVKERPSAIRLSNLSVALRNIGLNHHEQRKYRKTKPYYLRCLQIREELAKEQPDKYLPELACILADLGSHLLTQKNYKKANKYFQRSLQIAEQLAEEDAETHLPRLVSMYGNLSWNSLFFAEYSKSEKFARQALALDDTQLWIKVNLAHALLFQNRFSMAETIYMELSQTTEKNDKTFTSSILADFEALKRANAIPKNHKADVEKIKIKLTQTKR